MDSSRTPRLASSLPLDDLPAQVDRRKTALSARTLCLYQVLDLILWKLDSPFDIARLALVNKSIRRHIRNSRLRIKLCQRAGTVGPSEVETAKSKLALESFSAQFPCLFLKSNFGHTG